MADVTEKNPEGKLTPKQAVFVQEYLTDYNATQAAIRAGYSERSAQEIGSENLSKPLIAKAIEQAQAERAERLGITADRVINELAKLAFSNMEDYIKKDGNGLASIDLSTVDRGQAAAISELTVDTRKLPGAEDEVEKVKFKLVDKGVNLERLGKYLKLFTDKLETELSGNIEVTKIERTIVDPKDTNG